MTYRVLVLPRADADADEIARFLAESNGTLELAERWYGAVYDTGRAIGRHPTQRPLSMHRPPGDATLRHRAVDGFPNHLMFYRFDGRRVTVVRILHGSRDLGRLFGD